MSKSKTLIDLLDTVSEQQFGIKRSTAIDAQICVTCGGDAIVFNDGLSLREYKISSMCQTCQDEVFG